MLSTDRLITSSAGCREILSTYKLINLFTKIICSRKCTIRHTVRLVRFMFVDEQVTGLQAYQIGRVRLPLFYVSRITELIKPIVFIQK